VTDYKQIAALALAKCAAYDPWFPKASQAIVDSWSEHLEICKLGCADDVLAGVTRAYLEHGNGFKPLPKDISDAAKAVRRERRQLDADRLAAICDAKAAPDEVTVNRTRSVAEFSRGFGKAM
jgi:hypothetical protein